MTSPFQDQQSDEKAYRHPIVEPKENESIEELLWRAAETHRWPTRELKKDLKIFADLLAALPTHDEAKRTGSHVLRSLSFAADARMALNNLIRYIRARNEAGLKELAELRYNPEHLHFLSTLFSFSNYLSDIVISEPDFLDWVFRSGRLSSNKKLAEYQSDLQEWMNGTNEFAEKQQQMTRFKKRELLRIAIRDIMERADNRSLCRELSALAESCLAYTTDFILNKCAQYHGRPVSDPTGEICGYAVYAMGKFGAGELNFSSDIDLIFVYDEEGHTEGVPEGLGGTMVRRISNHEFFTKVSRQLSSFMTDSNPEGFLFRVDSRLRPEGIDGPLVRSRPAYASYLASQAGLWEKLPYMKARFVSGNPRVAELLDPIIEQFVYTGNEPDKLIPEIAWMKKRIDYDALTEEGRQLDIKRGSGGIREIEFIVAGLQLPLAETQHEFRVKGTLEALDLLVTHHVVDQQVASRLEEAYHLFRRIEHTLQMMNEAQTHRLPDTTKERSLLALRCGFLNPADFEKDLDTHRQFVRHTFQDVFRIDESKTELTLEDYLFGESAPPSSILEDLRPVELHTREGFQSLKSLAVGTAEFSPSSRGRESFQKLLPVMMRELPSVAIPNQAVRQFDLLLRAAKGHTWVYELCLAHPLMLRMLLRTLGFGSMLARLLIGHPEWLDEIFSNDGLTEGRTQRALDSLKIDVSIQERQASLKTIRQLKTLEGFLITVQEVLAITPHHDAARRMTLLADVVLQKVAETVINDITGGKGLPVNWVVLGLGGLGDNQVHFHGDLDIAIVYEKPEENGFTVAQQVDRVFHAFIKEIASYTPQGQLWKIDARLRPDGAGGSLCTNHERFMQCYERSAGIWEWQVLTKARVVAGDESFGKKILNRLYMLAPEILQPLNLKSEVSTMRKRMEGSLKLPKTARKDLKLSPGGVVDIEFLTQYLKLEKSLKAEELFPLTTEEALQHFTNDGTINQEDGEFLSDHLANIRMIQRQSRLLFETNNDYLWEDQERLEALARGLEDQRILNALPGLEGIEENLKKGRRIVSRYLDV